MRRSCGHKFVLAKTCAVCAESARPSTLSALDGNTTVYFTDYVRAGEVVDVYGTFEDAENEHGPTRRMQVIRDVEDWLLTPVLPEETRP